MTPGVKGLPENQYHNYLGFCTRSLSSREFIRLPHRSPNLNAYVERFVLSIKSECLERMIFFSEQSLRRAVAEFIHHYHGGAQPSRAWERVARSGRMRRQSSREGAMS